jgi:hypothetical protein
VRHAGSVQSKRIAYKGNPKKKGHLGGLGIDLRIVLKTGDLAYLQFTQNIQY